MSWNRRILCVDDEKGILEAYKDVFNVKKNDATSVYLGRRKNVIKIPEIIPEKNTFSLFLAASGEEAIELVIDLQKQNKQIAAAFIDMNMPGGMDGLETMQRLLKIDDSINFAVVTAYTDRSIEQIGSIFNDQDRWIYFNKPFTRGELLQAAYNLSSSWNLRFERNSYLFLLKQNQDFLKSLIEESSKIFRIQTLNQFYINILKSCTSLFNSSDGCIIIQIENSGFKIHSAVGSMKNQIDTKITDNSLLMICSDVVESGKAFLQDNIIIIPIALRKSVTGLIYVKLSENSKIPELDILTVLARTIAAAETNLKLFHRLEDMHRKIVQIDQRKSRFIALASHELKTPMVSIKGYTDLLISGELGEMSKQQIKALNTVKENSDRLSKLTEKILYLSKMDAGTLELNFQSVNVNSIINNIQKEILPLIEKRSQKFLLSLPSELPSIKADLNELKKVFIQIILNAIKYTQDGGTIELKAEREKKSFSQVNNTDFIVFSIKDTGIGIPNDEINKIFDKFYEAKPTSYHFSGTTDFLAGGAGLGLAIVKNVVFAHNGTISVKSEVGSGSTFTFKIPTWKL